jgi:phage/plasmid-like protein (TIGR03299 family)
LDITDGVASFASAREHAWHRLGTVLPDAMTAEQALAAAHLAGWNVRKKPLYVEGDPVLAEDGVTLGGPVEVPGKFATVRTNPINQKEDVLGVVGEQYTIIQNEENADILNAIVDESGAHFETGAALFGGRQTFLSMKLPRAIELRGAAGVDVTELYLIARNSHDGSSAFQLMVSPVRPVCMNTLAAAIREAKSQFAIRHTTNARQNIQLAREALGMTWKYVDVFEKELQKMIHREVSRSDATITLRKVLKFDEKALTERSEKNQNARIGEILKLWTSSDTLNGFHGSSYGLYQAVAEWADHYSPTWAGQGQAEMQRAERIAKGGEMQRIKTETFTLLTV